MTPEKLGQESYALLGGGSRTKLQRGVACSMVPIALGQNGRTKTAGSVAAATLFCILSVTYRSHSLINITWLIASVSRNIWHPTFGANPRLPETG